MSPHMNELETAAAAAREMGATRFRIEVPDLDGNLRGKYMDATKVSAGKRVGFPIVVFDMSIRDDVFELIAPDTGYPDVVCEPDWTTLRPVPWERGLAAVIGEFRTTSGEPYELDTRCALRRAVERSESAGFEARFGVEFELYLFKLDEFAERALRSGRPRELIPASRERQAYGLWRWPEIADFVADLQEKLLAYGVAIETVHAEHGFGAIEVTLSPAAPIEAADQAARFKLATKELARRHGLLATFIATWDVNESGSGAHLHQSLMRNGRNAFWDCQPGQLSRIGRHYLAGLIATGAELSIFMTPFPNSYRRFRPNFSAGMNLSWGIDDRGACFRVLASEESSARIENRRPGADFQPYLSIAACLDGGIHGVVKGMEPPPAGVGRSYEDPSAGLFPPTLGDAAISLRSSVLARQLYGDRLVEHYASSREAELAIWHSLHDAQIPDWEIARYLETA